MRAITHGAEQLATGDLAKAEARVGCVLPSDYRKFLLKWNGGPPIFPLFRMGSSIQTIQSFLRISTESTDDLLSARDALSDTIEAAKFIPIARTTCGDMVCLRLYDGAVFFWHHDQRPDAGEFDALYYLTESFTAFSDMLYAEESRETGDPVHRLGKNGGSTELAAAFASGRGLISKDGYSAGEIAAMHGNLDLFTAWLALGRPIGRSLHIAAMNGSFPIIDQLIGLGCDINKLDEKGKTPLDAASWNDDYKRELQSRGAKTSGELGR